MTVMGNIHSGATVCPFRGNMLSGATVDHSAVTDMQQQPVISM